MLHLKYSKLNKFNLSPCRGRNQTHNKPADRFSTAPSAPPCGANAAAADDDSPTAPSVRQQDELHIRRLPSHSSHPPVATAYLRLSGRHRFEHLRGKRWQEGDARRVLERSREVAEAACQRTLLLLIHCFGERSHTLVSSPWQSSWPRSWDAHFQTRALHLSSR